MNQRMHSWWVAIITYTHNIAAITLSARCASHCIAWNVSRMADTMTVYRYIYEPLWTFSNLYHEMQSICCNRFENRFWLGFRSICCKSIWAIHHHLPHAHVNELFAAHRQHAHVFFPENIDVHKNAISVKLISQFIIFEDDQETKTAWHHTTTFFFSVCACARQTSWNLHGVITNHLR